MITVQYSGSLCLIMISGFLLSGCHISKQPDVLTTTRDYEEMTQTADISLTLPPPHYANDKISPLEEQLLNLETQLNDLKIQSENISQESKKLKRSPTKHKSPQPTRINGYSLKTKTERARQLYRSGQYSQVTKLLKKADHPNGDSANDQQQMWLLLQSHAQLNNCESVINISQRFVNQFPRHPEAAHALYLMANCQKRLQQEDMMRVTYKRIISHYPRSNYAKTARQQLKP